MSDADSPIDTADYGSHSHREVAELWQEIARLVNVERAARDVDEFFGGRPGRWTFDRRVLGERSSTALLSLRDYLNDVEAARRNEAS